MKNRTAPFSITAVLLAVSGCSSSDSTIDAARLLEERCGVCHTTNYAKNARKSRSDWEETVTRMIAKGAKLSPEETKALVRYLAKTYRY